MRSIKLIAAGGVLAIGLMGGGLVHAPGAQAAGLYHSPNAYEDYIIQHESSGRSWAVNYLGCIGLMQSCPYRGTPAGLATSCPGWQYDIDCQLNFFTGYMLHRYGSWYNAWLHSRAYGWW